MGSTVSLAPLTDLVSDGAPRSQNQYVRACIYISACTSPCVVVVMSEVVRKSSPPHAVRDLDHTWLLYCLEHGLIHDEDGTIQISIAPPRHQHISSVFDIESESLSEGS